MADTAILGRLAEYRSAARRAVEANDAGDRLQLLALVELVELARREEDPTLRTWAERTVWSEAQLFVLGEEPPVLGDPWERAQRELRLNGYDRCPTCRSQIQTLEQLNREHRGRLKRIEEYEAKLEAVDRG